MRALAYSPSDGDQDLASEWSEGGFTAPAGVQVRSRGRLVRLSTLVVVAVGGTVLAFHWRGRLRVAPAQRDNLFVALVEEEKQVNIETIIDGLDAVAAPSDSAEPGADQSTWADDVPSADDGGDSAATDGEEAAAAAAAAELGAESSGTSPSALESAMVPVVNGAAVLEEAERRPGKGCINWATIAVEHPAVIKSTAEDCAAECRSFPGCTGFQYHGGECNESSDGDEPGACYIWKGLCVETENSCVDNFQTVPYTFALWAIAATRTTCRNEDVMIRGEGAFNANACGQRCAEDDLCNLFAYGGDGQCALFKGTLDDCAAADDGEWDLYVMDRANDVIHAQAKHANERDEAAASGAEEPAQGVADPGAVSTRLTSSVAAGDEEIEVEDASGFHDDDVLFIKSSGEAGDSEHNKVKVVTSGEAGNVLKLVENLKHDYHPDSTEVQLVKQTAR